MKNFIFLPFILGFSGCHTVGDALNPISQNYDYKTRKNDRGETVTEFQKAYIPQPSLFFDHSSSIVPVPSTPSYYSSPGTELKDDRSELRYKSVEEHEFEDRWKEKPSNDFNLLAFAELSGSSNSTHLGLHIGGEPNPHFLMRVGVSLFYSSQWYAGFDASARLQMPTETIKPFAGIGGYIGDAESCEDTSALTQKCERKYLGAGYGEIGFEISNFSLFYRNYNINRAGISIPDQDFIGLGIRFTTDGK